MYDEIIENILPNALMIGVPYDLFWELNPKSLTPFIKAFSLKQKQLDYNMWLQGMYIQKAVGSNLSKECKYPNKPFTMLKEKTEMDILEIKSRFIKHARILNAEKGVKGFNGK